MHPSVLVVISHSWPTVVRFVGHEFVRRAGDAGVDPRKLEEGKRIARHGERSQRWKALGRSTAREGG